jgi:hypothetical protein
VVYQVNGSRVEWNPSAARSRELTGKMPNASVTQFGNVNVKARADSRGTRSTYLAGDSANSRGQTITQAEYERVAVLQDARIAVQGAVEWAGDPDFGYHVAAAGPGVDDIEILQPGRRCDRPGRAGEHAARAARLKQERQDFPGSFPGSDESLVKSLG